MPGTRPPFLCCAILGSLLLLGTGDSLLAQELQDDNLRVWIGQNGETLPFTELDEIERFLLEARVVQVDGVPHGITKPKRMTLERDGIRMRAIFRDVSVYRRFWQNSPYGPQSDFHDQCIYECAAYRLSRLIGLPHVPPTVRRKFRRKDFVNAGDFGQLTRKEGSLQIWVEQAMTEKDRADKGVEIPDPTQWARQYQLMHLWDNLVFNLDRNQTNVLIGPTWKVWFIDQTRAFRPFRELRDIGRVRHCDRKVWQRLLEVEDREIEAALKDLLPRPALKALLERRARIVQYLRDLIQQQGEARVLFDLR
jgi:hypothetical protein